MQSKARSFSPRLGAAVVSTRCAARASALAGRGGTSLPGLVGLKLEPDLVRLLAAQLGGGAILVAGTNGKTTTSALTAAALRAGGRRVLHNRAGSNMLRGVATTLAGRAGLGGRLRSGEALTGLFEVDEAAMPRIAEQVAPRVVLITNLFRDQLDRYGELATIAGRWREAIAALPATTTLVLNADDPLVASLADAAPGPVIFYGIEEWPADRSVADHEPALSADSLFCPRCAAALAFSRIAYAHLGQYACPRCGWSRPAPEVRAVVRATGAAGSTVRLEYRGEAAELVTTLPGRYNVYNAVAAVATAVASGVDLGQAVKAVATARGAFGRAETVRVDGRAVRLFLIKNPTGADEVIRVVAAGDRRSSLLCLLSDNAADGHDVSWIWDARLELLAGWTGPLLCGGTRADDMAVRLKYAEVGDPATVLAGDIGQAVRAAVERTPRGGSLVILATYTAMLAARGSLARDGHLAQYWRKRG